MKEAISGKKDADELCDKKRGRNSEVDALLWNEEVNEAISGKKDADELCGNMRVGVVK